MCSLLVDLSPDLRSWCREHKEKRLVLKPAFFGVVQAALIIYRPLTVQIKKALHFCKALLPLLFKVAFL